MKHSLKKGVLKVGDRSVVFPIVGLVKQVLLLREFIIVRLDTPDCKVADRNVFAVDQSGNIRWRISERLPKVDDTPNPITNIWIDEKGRLMAYAWEGRFLMVDPNTGAVTDADPGARLW